MAKRMTDTEKWKKQWFRKLSPEYKCFWFYLLDNCNLAGIWDVDFETANFFIGGTVNLDYEHSKEVFADHIFELDNGKKWFIVDFIKFQYNELSYDSKPHLAVLRELERLNLMSLLLDKGYVTLQDKDKDKDKDKVKNKAKDIEKEMKDFEFELNEYKGIYPDQMLKEFYDYWSEPNLSKTKLRKDTEKTWDLERRLNYWANRSKKFGSPNQTTAQPSTTKMSPEVQKQREFLANKTQNNN